MMFWPFFRIAMQSAQRQLAFRRLVIGHVLFVSFLSWLTILQGMDGGLAILGYVLLCLAMVEAAALVGWRLAQLPKSQALEFLLVSPIQPKRVFFAETFVGVGRFLLVSLSPLPLFAWLIISGFIYWEDLAPLLLLPMIWGVTATSLVTAWVYEPVLIRRIGEIFALLGVLVYLVVGVLAGEHLVLWLNELPRGLAQVLYDLVIFFHTMNPFGVVRYWFANDAVPWISWERLQWLSISGVIIAALAVTRAAFRLRGHFQDRHYQIRKQQAETLSVNGTSFSRKNFPFSFADKPLSWWAVRRVMEYSGRVNFWLAGGFSLIYSAYIIAGDAWPAWMGKLVFQLFEQWGGVPTIATAMAVLAAVPAVFQFGLWDATTQDRCKRLELLLLSDIQANDYWHASLAAAWRRGRGYLLIATMLWVALAVSGRVMWWDSVAAFFGGVALWYFSFAFGFRSFAKGNATNGLASLMTLGLPLLLMVLMRAEWITFAAMLPAGLCHIPVSRGWNWGYAVGMIALLSATVHLTRTGLRNCDADLRRWYDENQGKKSVE